MTPLIGTDEEQRYKYLDQFVLEYRRGDRVPKTASKDDADLVDRMLLAMRRYEIARGLHQDALKKPKLAIEEALKQAKIMGTKEKDLGKVANELELRDMFDKMGTLRHKSSFDFLELLDAVNARRLIQPSEDIIRKEAECEQEKIATEKQLHDAQQRIVELEKLVRLLGGDPTSTKKTLTGDVGKGGDSDEHS